MHPAVDESCSTAVAAASFNDWRCSSFIAHQVHQQDLSSTTLRYWLFSERSRISKLRMVAVCCLLPAVCRSLLPFEVPERIIDVSQSACRLSATRCLIWPQCELRCLCLFLLTARFRPFYGIWSRRAELSLSASLMHSVPLT